MTHLLVRLGGESGIDNAISAGDVLTRSVARSGYHVHTFRTYPAEIKGGPVMFQLRVGVQPVPSLGDQLDVLLAFNEEAWDLHHDALRPDGVLVYDPGEHDAPEGFPGHSLRHPPGPHGPRPEPAQGQEPDRPGRAGGPGRL